jgi:glycosyltransferase involved in cell wall biosynthesis
MDPLISVILPFRNAKNTLRDSVESILNQTFTRFELILVNNASSDGGAEIARFFAHHDERVKLAEERKKGVVFAHNKGLELARGRYIARMDADDVAYPAKLEKQFRFLEENPCVDVVSCLVHYEGGAKNQGMRAYVDWVNSFNDHDSIVLNQFVESPVVNPTALFRKTTVEKYGSYRQGNFPEDYELWLRWIECGAKIHKINECLFSWHDSDMRLTRTDERYSINAFYEIKSVYLNNWLKMNNPFYPKVAVWGAGRKSAQRLKFLTKLGVEIDFYIDLTENKIKNTIHYEKIPAPGQCFILSYIGNRGKRDLIRGFLVARNYIEGRNFLLVA